MTYQEHNPSPPINDGLHSSNTWYKTNKKKHRAFCKISWIVDQMHMYLWAALGGIGRKTNH